MDRSNEDQQNWEFKIVRSGSGAFRKPENLSRMLEEEASAGWELVEKFDNNRIRLKRLSSRKNQDHMLPPNIDPYRSSYGGATAQILIGVVLAVLLISGFVAFFAFGNRSGTGPNYIIPSIALLAIMLLIGLFIAVIVAKKR